ncbi:MAG: tRNA (cytidine(34)-2'-O)-methyltransferase [Syntrophomonas sp.]|uniref:tRNA (cytidine(34)-2'-O)-methyltransferase n=1 Tax=Syntrophomonas sp. TaxID=2053627 RepID=UPI0026266631|nr:tRNA (cytidine(34)-2'-O)-methyltransferase [Syntrophomonas sp.]MDD2510995.1 tRNA (cytidine(34)-2'-O)-methyltransferase [Syntrophomonas sp.]MDD4626775.1 tRNA (cytidine(34)-2'-O)-methyltransferase [Syntrophomonas sp.]
MHIVLVEPEIPQNTGNIARSCALTKTTLHLVKPLGFSLADRFLKRAGLDYWDQVEVQLWENFWDLLEANNGAAFYLATTRAKHSYHQVSYREDSWLVFGRESSGLSISILNCFPDSHIRIPMRDIGRSLNLSNSAAIILYEALRQNSFPGLR